jgi:hypothetical protein
MKEDRVAFNRIDNDVAARKVAVDLEGGVSLRARDRIPEEHNQQDR